MFRCVEISLNDRPSSLNLMASFFSDVFGFIRTCGNSFSIHAVVSNTPFMHIVYEILHLPRIQITPTTSSPPYVPCADGTNGSTS